ncbi:MAG: hypothetical protein IPM84_14680 [Anaerolineae bacterium]|nr:hypothetical protein [Anaerolineae bacterium]
MRDLAYQRQAVISTGAFLDAYNGVFLADMVGLGETFISALLAQQLTDDGPHSGDLPPVLKEYWEETFQDFQVPATVESLGKLERIVDRLSLTSAFSLMRPPFPQRKRNNTRAARSVGAKGDPGLGHA